MSDGSKPTYEELRAASLEGQVENLRLELARAVGPVLLWVDRQLRRSPRLYAWLSR